MDTILTPGGGRRRLGLPPRRRPPPGHLPRCDIAAAGTLPWRPRRASPRPVPAVRGISSLFPPPFLFLFISFPHSRTTREPKSLTSVGKNEKRMREAPSGTAWPLPPAGARSRGRPRSRARLGWARLPGGFPRARLGPAGSDTRHRARPAGQAHPPRPGTCPRTHPAALRRRCVRVCVCAV